MTSLQDLKDKWFVDVSQESVFPPQSRHRETTIQPYSDGNLVEPLIDGAAIMGDFHFRVEEMVNSDNPEECLVFVAAMGIDPVKLLGENGPAKDAMATMIEAAEAGVKVYFLGSGQGNMGSKSKRFAEKLIERGSQGAIDKRFPGMAGGHHQKFNASRGPDGKWSALVSSADFFFSRWDTPDHAAENPERPPKGGPTHDFGLKVQGPAVADVVGTFEERWNDPSSVEGASPPVLELMPAYFGASPIASAGTHSVQVLRSFPLIEKGKGYSWSDQGEYTIWAAYLQAIKAARQYIYIEDQYLYAFHDPPYIKSSTGLKRDTDFVYQLGEALKRGVDVVVLAPGRNNAIWKHYEIQQRRRAAEYLQGIASASPGHGRFIICKLRIGGTDPTIHSKLMLVDDEYILAGSANICQRSIAYISELQLGVVDEDSRLVKKLRLALWQEHLELDSPESLLNPSDAVGAWLENASGEKGRLRLLPSERFKPEFPYRILFNRIVDPYSGPDRGS